MESFPAVLAWVGSGVRMYQKMGGQRTGSLEGLPTLLAFENFFHAVDSPGGKGENIIIWN